MSDNKEMFLWTEKYRPQTLDDLILDPPILERCKSYVQKGEIPHLLLHGIQGVGKCLDYEEDIEIYVNDEDVDFFK